MASGLAELIPSVIGLTGDDPHIDARIALRCTTMALPVVAAERQRVMAVSVLACERVLAALDGRPAGERSQQSRAVLARVPPTARWAEQFTSGSRSPPAFCRHAAPSIVCDAVEGIARACVPDPDGCCAGCWSRRSTSVPRWSAATRTVAPRSGGARGGRWRGRDAPIVVWVAGQAG
jgi:hypothetical protein